MSKYLTDILSSLAQQSPDAPMLTLLAASGEEQNVSARQLHGDAGQIAIELRAHGIRPGELLPLIYEHGYDVIATFWGALYAGAVPTILPYVNRDARSSAILDQVKRLARFVEAETVIAPSDYEAYLRDGLGDSTRRIVCLPPRTTDSPKDYRGRLPDSYHGGPAYVQFSSGTTGRPKGVCLADAALLHYLRVAIEDTRPRSNDVMVGWLPLYHDMGLVNQLLQPMYGRYRSVFIDPSDWLREPHRLFQAMTQYRGTFNWMPNFGFRYCLRRVPDERLTGVDLSSWRIAGNGSEPALLEDMEAFVTRFAAYGLSENAICIGYGMSEHVAGATWTLIGKAPTIDWVSEQGLASGSATPVEPHSPGSRAIMSCGAPLPTTLLRVVDAQGKEVPDRNVGEPIIQSPILFHSYYRQPEETARVMEGGWFHSGDLGYLTGGELFICGRKKDLIIIAGRNIHPLQLEEIAEAVLGSQGRFAAAFGVTNASLGTEIAVLVCEMRKLPEAPDQERLRGQIREQARRTLEIFVAEVLFVEPGWIVRTTSGKINRGANREKYLARSMSA